MANTVAQFYKSVIDDVCSQVREAFLDDGVHLDLVQDLKQEWQTKLMATGCLSAPSSTAPAAVGDTSKCRPPVPRAQFTVFLPAGDFETATSSTGLSPYPQSEDQSWTALLQEESTGPTSVPSFPLSDLPAAIEPVEQVDERREQPLPLDLHDLDKDVDNRGHHLNSAAEHLGITTAAVRTRTLEAMNGRTDKAKAEGTSSDLASTNQLSAGHVKAVPVSYQLIQGISKNVLIPTSTNINQPAVVMPNSSRLAHLQREHHLTASLLTPKAVGAAGSRQVSTAKKVSAGLSVKRDVQQSEFDEQLKKQSSTFGGGRKRKTSGQTSAQQTSERRLRNRVIQLDGNASLDESEDEVDDALNETLVMDGDDESEFEESENSPDSSKSKTAADEEDEPLNSGDDATDEEEDDAIFDVDNVILCQYEKVSRARNKWKCILKDGIMRLNGVEHIFQKATGEADW